MNDKKMILSSIGVILSIAIVKESYNKIGVIDNSSIERYISSYLSTSIDKKVLG